MIFLFPNTLWPPVNKLFLSVTKFSLYIYPYISFSRLVPMTYVLPLLRHCAGFECRTRHQIFNCFDSCLLGVLICSYIHAHVYSTSIYDLLLFLIPEWSQFFVTIFIQTQLLYLYSFIRFWREKWRLSWPVGQ